MATTDGFQFTDDDAEIVHYVYQLRLATIDHLVTLTGRSYKALERRVLKNRKEKYLRRLRPQPSKGLYVIGPKAIPVLIEGGYAPGDLTGKRRRESEWKDLGINHALLVASILTKLLLLSRSGPIRLVYCQYGGPALWDRVETRKGRLPVRPDLYLVLQDVRLPSGKNKFHFFLEADVGTMSHRKIEQKITAYAAYHRQQRHVAKFGINSFQVAIVTQTPARAKSLKAELHSAMSAAQQRAYHFVPLDDLTLAGLLPTKKAFRQGNGSSANVRIRPTW